MFGTEKNGGEPSRNAEIRINTISDWHFKAVEIITDRIVESVIGHDRSW